MPHPADVLKIAVMAFLFVYLFNWFLMSVGLGAYTTDAANGG